MTCTIPDEIFGTKQINPIKLIRTKKLIPAKI